jgi:antitoxin ParD1/3/4
MPTRNINLTEHLDLFVEAGIKSGRYGNASEVVREGLRLLERRQQEDQARLESLRSAAKEGFGQLDRGEGIGFKSMEALDEVINRLGQEVSGAARRRA